MVGDLDTNKVCIVIASHISNPKRIGHLIECLTSNKTHRYYNN